MKLIFEKGAAGRFADYLPACDVPETELPAELLRESSLDLPQLAEIDVSRHYSELERRSFGVNNGFYPLGSCTMKYNPRIAEKAAALPGFTDIHPLQPESTVKGCKKVLDMTAEILCHVTGMDAMTFQPAAGAHGELTGVMLIKKYHESRGDLNRKKIIVPDSAHGTNPATAAMCGMEVVNVPSGADGCVDIEKLAELIGDDTAGLMLTNPNTLGIFEKNISEITRLIHQAGGLVYYDGANLNAVMGVVRPGDMGFDCVHLNLHKTFGTPHGGGGPGCGAVGCKDKLKEFMPGAGKNSIGRVKSFYGNFLVVVRTLSYLLTLGSDGMKLSAMNAVLNANYMKTRLAECYDIPYGGICMHEFVISLEKEAREKHVTAMDIAKTMLDYDMHPPTMYFPLIVRDALMVEPTETESLETMDNAIDIFLKIYREAMEDPKSVQSSPKTTVIGRPDEVEAARHPVLRYGN